MHPTRNGGIDRPLEPGVAFGPDSDPSYRVTAAAPTSVVTAGGTDVVAPGGARRGCPADTAWAGRITGSTSTFSSDDDLVSSSRSPLVRTRLAGK
jgi:hypothetical protein